MSSAPSGIFRCGVSGEHRSSVPVRQSYRALSPTVPAGLSLPVPKIRARDPFPALLSSAVDSVRSWIQVEARLTGLSHPLWSDGFLQGHLRRKFSGHVGKDGFVHPLLDAKN